MNLHKWLAAVIVILALVGCIQVATGPGQAPYSRESGAIRAAVLMAAVVVPACRASRRLAGSG
jgi:hypothetical protein